MAVVQAALRALRLNHFYPEWRGIAAHAAATGVQGWPAPDDWLRVRVDQRLAPEVLRRLGGLEGEDAAAALKARSFRALLAAELLPHERSELQLVSADPARPVVQWVFDRNELATASFIRWTLRLAGGAAHLRVHDGQVEPSLPLTRRLRLLCWHSALELHVGLSDLEDLHVLDLHRGEVGSIRPLAGEGAPWLSAVLSRISPELPRIHVDDPLVQHVLVPREDAGLGMSRTRKWAVPQTDLDRARRWLRAQGSRNLVYSYPPDS